jgi:hypothetical protein
MQYLDTQLELKLMEVEFIGRNAIKVTDSSGDTITFRFENGSVVWE